MIDGHAHLSEIEELAGPIARAKRAGVAQILAVGMDMASNRRTLALAEQYGGMVLPAIGYHPWNIKIEEMEATLAHMDAHLGRCVAVGEVGLDYKIKVKKALQREVFAQVLHLANSHRLPVIVHARYSHRRWRPVRIIGKPSDMPPLKGFWWKPTVRWPIREWFPSRLT